MATWLETILEELATITDEEVAAAEPEKPVSEGDCVVGVMNSEMRKLYALYHRYAKQCDLAAAAFDAVPVGAHSYDHLHAAFHRADESEDALREIWRVSLKDAYPELWIRHSIGFRAGWQIVYRDEPRGAEPRAGVFGVIIAHHLR